jgi:HSP20 family protein
MTPVVRRPSGGPTMMRWSPISEFEELHRQMGQLVGSLPEPGDGAQVWVPFVDIEETEDAWILEAELPGVDRNDVHVEMRENELVISGEVKDKERPGILRRRARRVGEFEYRVTLPGQVDPESIQATLSDGILTVRVPKSEKARPRQIEVQAG